MIHNLFSSPLKKHDIPQPIHTSNHQITVKMRNLSGTDQDVKLENGESLEDLVRKLKYCDDLKDKAIRLGAWTACVTFIHGTDMIESMTVKDGKAWYRSYETGEEKPLEEEINIVFRSIENTSRDFVNSYGAHLTNITPLELKQNKLFVSKAVEIFPDSLSDAEASSKEDKHLVLKAVRKNGCALRYATEVLRNDPEVVYTAVQNSGKALEFASVECCNNRNIVLEAIKTAGEALKYASNDLKSDRDFILQAAKYNVLCLRYAADHLKQDEHLMLEACKHSDFALTYASEDLRSNRDFLFKALKLNALVFTRFSKKHKRDREMALEAVKKNKLCYEFIVGGLKYDPAILWNQFGPDFTKKEN